MPFAQEPPASKAGCCLRARPCERHFVRWLIYGPLSAARVMPHDLQPVCPTNSWEMVLCIIVAYSAVPSSTVTREKGANSVVCAYSSTICLSVPLPLLPAMAPAACQPRSNRRRTPTFCYSTSRRDYLQVHMSCAPLDDLFWCQTRSLCPLPAWMQQVSVLLLFERVSSVSVRKIV
ncbi:hypothetical protein DL89DRAFT_130895 [Linderina pennispora]|uniref:Uncharacterized protein n=1 Tax=Linderina pennispora TaxID=61395 RepID=A0A1Y1VVA9_9FUNG|nr:uncharacterized protein DL89DRAFT_130895 [Linderina pennispora]ORX65228.1 hypothetical protein DL89DRAFT_130895 [Linderina pennispora]